MQIYIGVKKVEAAPMSENEFRTEKGEPFIPSDPGNGRPGYKVQYPDGYTSWCPKETFEKANLNLGYSDRVPMRVVEGFIQRTEVSDLDKKTTMVRAFLINGFVITETSSCADPANYDRSVGEESCMSKIQDRVWDYLGFLLCCAKNGMDGRRG